MSESSSKTVENADTSAVMRPWGISFSFAANTIMGAYYLAYPLFRDVGLYPLYTLGVLSLVAAYSLFRMSRWGVWLGAALFPAQIVAPVFAFLATIESPGIGSDYEVIVFAASFLVLMFLSTLSFLFILDKRKSSK